MSLLHQYPLGRATRRYHWRPDASCPAMPRAGLVDGLRLERYAGGAVAPAIPGRSCRNRYFRPADPFPTSNHRTDQGRRREVSLPIHSRQFSLIWLVPGRLSNADHTREIPTNAPEPLRLAAAFNPTESLFCCLVNLL